MELRKVEGREVKRGKNQGGDKKGVCIHSCVLYICFTSKCFCYESLLEAEQIPVNGTISETRRVKVGIQIIVLLASHLLSVHLHNYS